MTRRTRIWTSAWPAALCAIAALTCAASSCSLDTRTLEPTKPAALGAGDGGALGAPNWRRQRAPSGSSDAATEPDADVSGPPGPNAAGSPGTSGSGMSGSGGSGSGPTAGDASTEGGTSPEAGTPDCHRLVFGSEWIDDFSNCLDIQGEVWADPGDGDEVFSSHTVSEPICMTDPPPSSAPTTFGFHLNQANPDAMPTDYDARLHDVVGFRFRISDYQDGLPFPFVGVESQGEIYCTELSGTGDRELLFTDFRVNCWESSSGPAPDPEHIRSLLFYYPADYPGEPISMCFGNVFAIVDPG